MERGYNEEVWECIISTEMSLSGFHKLKLPSEDHRAVPVSANARGVS